MPYSETVPCFLSLASGMMRCHCYLMTCAPGAFASPPPPLLLAVMLPPPPMLRQVIDPLLPPPPMRQVIDPLLPPPPMRQVSIDPLLRPPPMRQVSIDPLLPPPPMRHNQLFAVLPCRSVRGPVTCANSEPWRRGYHQFRVVMYATHAVVFLELQHLLRCCPTSHIQYNYSWNGCCVTTV